MALLEDQIAFAEANPWAPAWPAEMVRRFLSDLVSSPDQVRYVPGQWLAVVLDRVQNPGRNASLEILGASPDRDPAAVFTDATNWARTRVPPAMAGYEVAVPPGLEALAEAQGLQPYYRTFGLVNEAPGSVAPPPAGLCTIVTDRDEVEMYEALKIAFAENVDTNISPFEEWQAARRAPSRSKSWGVWQEKKLVAFLNLVVPKAIALAEIRTVGVLPEYRGRGYAQALIRRALGYVAQLEIPRCVLTVAAHNDRALSLYQKLGFREVERQSVYRWAR